MLVGADVPPRVGLFQTITTKTAALHRWTDPRLRHPDRRHPLEPRLQHRLHHRRLQGFGRGGVDGGTWGDGQGGQWSTDREPCVACFDHGDQSGCVSSAAARLAY
jgi:hypothetical protein